MDTYTFLASIVDDSGISGYEHNLKDKIVSSFKPLSDDIWSDALGNIIVLKRGTSSENNIKIMLAAHMDEIGLMVKDIEENGFLRFTSIGGIDPRTILGQEVIVHGKEGLFGVVGSKPPHLQDADERNKAIKLEDMVIDVGLPKDKLEDMVNIGDPITINRQLIDLKNNRIAGKSLDDRTGIATLLECLKELNKMNHDADVYLVCTVQEEVSMAGAYTSAYGIDPDMGIAVDVGFGTTPELNRYDSIELGEGPGITLGGNIHPGLRERLTSVANRYNISYQMEITPGPTGTDARAIQITKNGIPSLVLSIPLRYMHTSVEVVDMIDVENTGKLLAFFINDISNDDLEGILCY